ncbi:MAG TPA: hypothetical protein QGG47_14470 [Acidobacteriota bacterium]|nr:hypothetical protein [Acidobacteriota bacterium]
MSSVRMTTYRVVLLGMVLGVLLTPTAASAQEVALTLGRVFGDDVLEAVNSGPGLGFGDAGIYGARVGLGAILVQAEGAILYSPTDLFVDTPGQIGSSITYAEVALAFKIIPGPVGPFIAGGIGHHRVSFDLADANTYTTVGYNFGAGVKLGLGSVGARIDVRDHITPLKVDKIDPDVLPLIGLDADKTVHNFEVSVGLVLSF